MIERRQRQKETTHVEKPRETEGRQEHTGAEGETREEQGRKERTQELIRQYRREDREARERKIWVDALRYAQSKETKPSEEPVLKSSEEGPLEIEPGELGLVEELKPVISSENKKRNRLEPIEIKSNELEPLEREHQENLKRINQELTALLKVQREQKEEFWSFLPGKRRVVAKLEQEITELKTRARIERMHIADITNEYHSDVKAKRTKEAFKPFFDAIKKPERPAPRKEDEDKDASGDVAHNLLFIRGLYKEKASLQAEREGWAMLIRPFRRHAIDARLEEVAEEIEKLQEEVRKSTRAA
ncbi:MAG: hypothetical protein AAB448_03840 [Patescibacteria group bacterium]